MNEFSFKSLLKYESTIYHIILSTKNPNLIQTFQRLRHTHQCLQSMEGANCTLYTTSYLLKDKRKQSKKKVQTHEAKTLGSL